MSLGRGSRLDGRQRLPVQRHRHAAGPAVLLGPGGDRVIVVERGDVFLALAVARGVLAEDDPRRRAARPARSGCRRSGRGVGSGALRSSDERAGAARPRPAGGLRRRRRRRGGARRRGQPAARRGRRRPRRAAAAARLDRRRRRTVRRGGGGAAGGAARRMQVLGDAAPVAGGGRAGQEAGHVDRAGDRRISPCPEPAMPRKPFGVALPDGAELPAPGVAVQLPEDHRRLRPRSPARACSARPRCRSRD